MGAKAKPKGWKSPFRVPLYQVLVERTDGGAPQVVGPAMLHDAAAHFRDAIAAQIKQGNERDWSNPTLINVKTAETLTV